MVAIRELVFGLLILVPAGTFGQESPCSPENRQKNLEGCLDAIRNKALDSKSFAFGSSYFDRCDADDKMSLECFNYEEVDRPYTLVEKAFRVPEQDLSSIDRYLNVVYASPPGTYEGCDTTYSYGKTKILTADPLSNIRFRPWDLREHPHSRWDHKDGEFFTLVVLYTTGETLAVISNIAGNDYTDALHQKPYSGPKNPRWISKPVVFIVYKQQIRQEPQAIPSYGFNVTEYAEKNQLQGPVAFTWHDIDGDIYSTEGIPFFQNCPRYVQNAISPYLEKYDFLPKAEDLDLSVHLRVKFISPSFTYSCQNYTVINPASEFYIDSISRNVVDTADVRADAERIYSLEFTGVNPDNQNGFDDKIFTMFMVEPTTKFLHGMTTNMHGRTLDFVREEHNTGDLLLTYTGPFPKNDGQRWHYMWLLFEQKEKIRLDLSKYLDKSCPVSGRCVSDLKGLIDDHDLKLVGLARMAAVYDEHTRCTTNQGPPKTLKETPEKEQNELC